VLQPAEETVEVVQTLKYAASTPIAAMEQHAVNFGGTPPSYARAEQDTAFASASPREEHASYGPPTPVNVPAAVIPMTRTLRIEVPPSSSSRQPTPPAQVERLLGIASRHGATALYLITDSSPYIRVDSDVRALEGELPLSAHDIEAAVLTVATDTSREALRRGEPLEWFTEVPGAGRVHCSTFRDHRGPGAIFQLISMRPMTAEQLGLSADIQQLATESQGLVLVASTRGNGRNTLVGAMVDLINRPNPEQLLAMTRAALRENPDVLVFEDLPPADVFALALEAAGSGVLVLMSVGAPSTTAALASAVELFAPEKRRAVQAQIAEHLRGAVAQVLLRHNRGGRAAARELLLPTGNVITVLTDGQLDNLPGAIEDGRQHGLVSLNHALVQLIRDDAIDLREAYRKTDDRSALIAMLKRENIDTAIVERLA
jgi:twitching motility protein PilT